MTISDRSAFDTLRELVPTFVPPSEPKDMARVGVLVEWTEWHGQRMRVLWWDWMEGLWQADQLRMDDIEIAVSLRWR